MAMGMAKFAGARDTEEICEIELTWKQKLLVVCVNEQNNYKKYNNGYPVRRTCKL